MSILTHSKIHNTDQRPPDTGSVPLAPLFALNALLFAFIGGWSMLTAPGPAAMVVMALAPAFLLLAAIGADWRTPEARQKPAKVTAPVPAAAIAVTAAGEAGDLVTAKGTHNTGTSLVLVQDPIADGGDCSGCVGRGTGWRCCQCGLPIPAELWRRTESPNEYDPQCADCLGGRSHSHRVAR